ncbi:kinase-like protein [Lepidopterella palustris CBS 459.81]|uniref:non-specific serine/threonine protein kinase n=1 Tax=Lepidopterella palustris CBS 459.81 TaxID=1314670 RepID=A0A8E2JAX0_9PEZI|nr:kinase-like protein [Lepidopterella palustris CBS 459.81]
MADPPWCERASKALYDKRVLQSGSPDFYYPRSIIVQVFQDFAIRELFLCGCERCRRHSLVAFGATDLASVFEDIESKLLGDYLTTYALLVSIDRPAFIGLFISEGVRLDGNHFLDATDLDFLALVSAPQVQDRVLREQWKFQIRPLAVTEDPMNYLPKEVLPIRYGEEIGRGQFGIVYKAFFPFPEYQGAGLKGLELPPLACKVFNCDNFELGLKEWGNHLHVNQKDHPNFMRALGAFTHGCDFCIIFPYAESTLEKQLQSDFPGLSSEAICKQMLDIVKAVDCLHGDNDRTIHSDLKPQNILVMNGMFKVADFGSLRLVEEIKDSKIRYVMVGRDYSPPESTIESPSYDIWSLAAILSEVFTADLQKRETLMRFRRERKAEDEDFVNSECFHKAKQLKLAVSTRFEELLDLVEKSKSGKGEKLSAWQERFYTRTLFDLLKDMLSPQGSGRPPASEVARKLSDLIHKASHIEVEQPSEVDIWRLLRERALPGDSPRPHLKFCATSAIDGADQRRRRCVLYFHRQFKPSRLSITRYHFDKDSKLVAVELYVSRRGSGHKVNNIEREVTGFYPSHLHPEEINLVFRDGHEDSYRLQSKIGESTARMTVLVALILFMLTSFLDALSLQGELTGLLVHNK